MAVIACVCRQRLEGDGEEALAAAIRRHSDEVHVEPEISDATIRGLVARQARMSAGEGRSRPLAEPPVVRLLTPQRLDDFPGFFDRDALTRGSNASTKPMTWSSCACRSWTDAHAGGS